MKLELRYKKFEKLGFHRITAIYRNPMCPTGYRKIGIEIRCAQQDIERYSS